MKTVELGLTAFYSNKLEWKLYHVRSSMCHPWGLWSPDQWNGPAFEEPKPAVRNGLKTFPIFHAFMTNVPKPRRQTCHLFICESRLSKCAGFWGWVVRIFRIYSCWIHSWTEEVLYSSAVPLIRLCIDAIRPTRYEGIMFVWNVETAAQSLSARRGVHKRAGWGLIGQGR